LGFGKNIIKYKDDILKGLARMVSIPSVCSQAEPGKPFGPESANALQLILKMAQDMGFATKNVGNYAGHAEYGNGSEIAAAVVHVDVVPAGDGWKTDPFSLTRRGNLYFGRGTADDKGAAVVALYCLKALKDAGVTGKRKVRVIFGAGEEIASNDLEMYFNKEPMPDMAFTPDSEYGVCNREKGILRVRISKAGNPSPVVRSFTAGTVVNAVPGMAEAIVEDTGGLLEKLKAAAEQIPSGKFNFEKSADNIKITSIGKACHAAQPQEGINAAGLLVDLMAKVLPENELGMFLSFMHQNIGMETDGASMGVKMSDGPSGPLTLNLGLVRINAALSSITVDIRYPVTCKGSDIVGTIRRKAEQAGLSAEKILENAPLYFPADHPIVHLLQDAYKEVKGAPAKLYATGGGTYAREIPGKAVAFGPLFKDEPDRGLHNANENINIDRFMEHAQICLEALYRMMIT